MLGFIDRFIILFTSWKALCINKSKDTQAHFSFAHTYIFIIVIVLEFYPRSTHPLFADAAIV